MKYSELSPAGKRMRDAFVTGLSLLIFMGLSFSASADEADAKRLLKAMSDYTASQTDISFDYDATLEVVTEDGQVLGLASSGSLQLKRPNKVRSTRMGGFADVEMNFDGTTLTILGKNLNIYTQVDIPGDISNLVDKLRNEYSRPLPAADLITKDSYDALMADVIDIKDLGSGVVGGIECDSLAFRKEDIDFQIWIAQGDKPYPCKYVITSKLIANGPKYQVQVSNWKAGSDVAAADFTFKNSSDAQQVDLKDLEGTGDLPANFELMKGGSQ